MDKKIIVTLIIGLIIGLSLSGLGTYAATSYAISASKIGYTDNSSLGATDVQAAIDGTCTKLANLKGDIVDIMWPVGSIYISETVSDKDVVENRFKKIGKDTTWVAYGEGKVLVGSGTGTDSNGKTQVFSVLNNGQNLGEYTHKLTVQEMPSHNHAQFVLSNPDTGSFSGRKDYAGDYSNMSAYTQGVPTGYAGGDNYHNNIQPYTTVYMYKRTK